jgi:hypothetical protein
METILLAIQARVLLTVGLLYLGLGLYLGTAPTTLAWRASLAAVVAMTIAGWLLRQVALVIQERMAADIAERQLAAEQAAAAAAAAAAPPTPAAQIQNRAAKNAAARKR